MQILEPDKVFARDVTGLTRNKRVALVELAYPWVM